MGWGNVAVAPSFCGAMNVGQLRTECSDRSLAQSLQHLRQRVGFLGVQGCVNIDVRAKLIVRFFKQLHKCASNSLEQHAKRIVALFQ